MKERRLSDMMPDALSRGLAGLGSDIAAARKARDMSQVDLADRLGVSRPTIARMEKGDHRVSLGLVAGAAWVMGLEDNLMDAFAQEKDPVFQREARLGQPKRAGRAGRTNRANTETPDDSLDF